MRAVVLLSGGLDSAVLLSLALSRGRSCLALSFDYGQRHRVELLAAEAVAKRLGAPHQLIRIDPSPFRSAPLAGRGELDKGKSLEEIKKEPYPSSYVPARNSLFLAFAMAQAELIDAGEIYYGANALDAAGYPDCSPAFVEAFQRVLERGSHQALRGSPPKLEAPLLTLDKAEIIRLGAELQSPLELTWSCYDPEGRGFPCRRCDACLLRREGFRQAGLEDPAQKNPPFSYPL